jgi:hypothetical protein
VLLTLLQAPAGTNDFTFTGVDASAWGSGWTFTQGTGDILTNRGRMVTGTGGFDGRSAYYDHGVSDADVSIDVEIPTNDDQFPEVRWRYNDGTGDGLLLIFEPHNDIVQVYPLVAYTRGSQIGSNIALAVAGGDIIHIRLVSVGNDHGIRLWLNGASEPTTFNRLLTNSTGAGQTQLMVRTVTSNLGVAITNYWDNFAVTAGSLGTTFTISPTGAITAAGALAKSAARLLVGSSTTSGLARKDTSRRFDGTSTASATVARATSKQHAGTITPTGTLTAIKVALLAIAGSITASGALRKDTSKQHAGNSTAAGALRKDTARRFAGTIAAAGTLGTSVFTAGLSIAIAGVISATGALRQAVAITRAGSITPASTITRGSAKVITGTTTATGVARKSTSKPLVGSSAPAGAVYKTASIVRTGATVATSIFTAISVMTRVVQAGSSGGAMTSETAGSIDAGLTGGTVVPGGASGLVDGGQSAGAVS